MKFSLHGTTLVNSLKSLDSLVGGGSENITLKFDGKKNLWLYRQGKKEDRVLVGKRLEVTGEGEGLATVNAATLSGFCRRNQELILEKLAQELKVGNKKNYQAKLPLVSDHNETKLLDKNLSKTVLPSHFHDLMRESIGFLSLNRCVPSEYRLTFSVWGGKKETIITSGDNYHSGFYRGKGTGDAVVFHIPLEYAQKMAAILEENQKISMATKGSNFYLWGKDIQIVWPLIKPHAQLEEFKELFQKKKIEGAGEFKTAEVKTTIDSLSPLYEVSSFILMDTQKNQVNLQARSDLGRGSESLKFKGKIPRAKLAINPFMLRDTLERLPEKFKMGFSKGHPDFGDRYVSMHLASEGQYGKTDHLIMLANPR